MRSRARNTFQLDQQVGVDRPDAQTRLVAWPNHGSFAGLGPSAVAVAVVAGPFLDEVLFVGEFDEEASPLGAKGLGELTAVSVAPAIANAIYHATGKRIRDLPITIEKLL
jgi:hypothetical protein